MLKVVNEHSSHITHLTADTGVIGFVVGQRHSAC